MYTMYTKISHMCINDFYVTFSVDSFNNTNKLHGIMK